MRDRGGATLVQPLKLKEVALSDARWIGLASEVAVARQGADEGCRGCFVFLVIELQQARIFLTGLQRCRNTGRCQQ